MSSSFKKIFPALVLVVIFAGGYLLSSFAGDIFSSGESESVATKAQAFQARLNYLNGVSGFDTVAHDPRIEGLTSITAVPSEESIGRPNPFIR